MFREGLCLEGTADLWPVSALHGAFLRLCASGCVPLVFVSLSRLLGLFLIYSPFFFFLSPSLSFSRVCGQTICNDHVTYTHDDFAQRRAPHLEIIYIKLDL